MTLAQVIAEDAEPTDPKLLALVREFLEPPSKHIIKLAHQPIKTPQAGEVLRILKNKVRNYTIINF